MLQKEEFQITVETIEPSLESLKGAIQGVHSFYELLKSRKKYEKNLITIFKHLLVRWKRSRFNYTRQTLTRGYLAVIICINRGYIP